MNIARLGNKYLADEEPWKIINTNPDRVRTIIFISIQISSILSIISEPFMPLTSKKIKDMLNYKAHKNSWTWDNISKKDFLISENIKLNEPILLFSKIEDYEIQKQIDKLNNNQE